MNLVFDSSRKACKVCGGNDDTASGELIKQHVIWCCRHCAASSRTTTRTTFISVLRHLIYIIASSAERSVLSVLFLSFFIKEKLEVIKTLSRYSGGQWKHFLRGVGKQYATLRLPGQSVGST